MNCPNSNQFNLKKILRMKVIILLPKGPFLLYNVLLGWPVCPDKMINLYAPEVPLEQIIKAKSSYAFFHQFTSPVYCIKLMHKTWFYTVRSITDKFLLQHFDRFSYGANIWKQSSSNNKNKKNYNPLFLAKANRVNGNPCIEWWQYLALETKW